MAHNRRISLWASLAISVALMCGVATPPAMGAVSVADRAGPQAPTFLVNSPFDAPADFNNDPNFTICRTNVANSFCTLRAAIMNANHFAAGGVTIQVPTGVYTLTLAPSGPDDERSGDLNITNTMTINGDGAGNSIIDGGGIDRVFYVDVGANLALSGLTIRGGQAPVGGGGIRNLGTLAVVDSVVSANSAATQGGGISNDGNATVSRSIISGNSSSSDGGGIFSHGLLTVAQSTISGNNSAQNGGGILSLAGVLTLTHSVVNNNASGGNFDGGGVDLVGTTATIEYTALSSNSARQGGGLANDNGTVTINRTTVSANRALGGPGGGIFNQGDTTLNNSTVSANSALTYGGGLDNELGTLRLFHTTVAGNVAASDAGGYFGGGLFNTGNSGAVIELTNSLIAENYGGSTPNDCSGATVLSHDYNYFQTAPTCALTGTVGHDVLGGDALLGPLQDNGGATPTRALLTGSPALDQIPPSQCRDSYGAFPVPDQRGVPRPVNGLCDIGAYEGVQPLPAFNSNLIRNGDAESGGSSQTGAFIGTPNWIFSNGQFTAVAYNSPGGFPSVPTDTVPANHGSNFFAGGNAALSTDYQNFDVSAFSGTIDAGNVTYALSGDLGGYLDQEDNATLTATFLDVTVSTLISVTIGPVTAEDRANLTGLLHRSATGLVPPGTRSILVVVNLTAVSGPYNDGYADNLSLVLTPPTLYLPLVLK